VDCYLPFYRQQLINYPLSALLHFQSLFTERSCGHQLLAPPPFSSALRAPCTLCCMLFSVPCLLFRFFFCRLGVSLLRRLCWFIPGVTVGIPGATYLFTCWSASPKQVWSQCLAVQHPSCFLSVTWHGEALYGLGVQVVRVLIFLHGFFCQVWL
jgi:hypothetical protein